MSSRDGLQQPGTRQDDPWPASEHQKVIPYLRFTQLPVLRDYASVIELVRFQNWKLTSHRPCRALYLLSLTRQQLKDYITTHYTAPRMVVAGAGAIDHSQLVDLSSQVSYYTSRHHLFNILVCVLCALLSQYFGNLPAQPPAGFTVPKDNPR